jgi:hypothetical protein
MLFKKFIKVKKTTAFLFGRRRNHVDGNKEKSEIKRQNKINTYLPAKQPTYLLQT